MSSSQLEPRAVLFSSIHYHQNHLNTAINSNIPAYIITSITKKIAMFGEFISKKLKHLWIIHNQWISSIGEDRHMPFKVASWSGCAVKPSLLHSFTFTIGKLVLGRGENHITSYDRINKTGKTYKSTIFTTILAHADFF